MNNKEKQNTPKDSDFEGRDTSYMDIDRMINEGMSGGSVHYRESYTNIEEARDLTTEEPPHIVE